VVRVVGVGMWVRARKREGDMHDVVSESSSLLGLACLAWSHREGGGGKTGRAQ